ncbi:MULTISPECIES: toll/interleukin-1 receptor domain-containing protein [unclassified Bradyrhizobium]|uniref:toll/interleukin-1 receptor domain-containing protein n=1 Tax=unclassified Bradyrhizobium TaxID=2631580 RepID=UPI0029161257|nr:MULTISPECIES: toll/interleukin-1 receptor domain-containing protein [unclassified Bradyrhizobium]
MSDRKHSRVFISYSHKDRKYALQIRDAISMYAEFDVWIDAEFIDPGKPISQMIMEGIKQSDYYLLLISESSNRSDWVKRELSVAFDLAKTKHIAFVPFLLEQVEIPFEIQGLLYIDGSKSFKAGLDELYRFFHRQKSKVGELAPQEMIRKGFDPKEDARRKCQFVLRDQELGDLRYAMSEKLTLKDIRVLWFDVFHTKMEDDVVTQDKALCCLELLDRSSRGDALSRLIDKICRNHPSFSSSL